MTQRKTTRKVTYRKWGVPAVILEGKWLEQVYGWKIGDHVNVAYEPHEIKLRKRRFGFATDLEKIKPNKKTPRRE